MVKYLLDTDHAIDLFRGNGVLEEYGAIRESVTLLTENARHFSRIPDLRTESWR